MKYDAFEIGQILTDKQLGCEWIVREKIPGGVRLQINKENGPFLDATNESCALQMVPKIRYYSVHLQENKKAPGSEYDRDVCIRAVTVPSLEDAEKHLHADIYAVPGHILHVVHIVELTREEAVERFDYAGKDDLPVFGLTRDMLPTEGRRIWDREQKECGTVRATGMRFCAGCQRVHPYYLVRWPKGNRTKPCTAGIEMLPNGDLHIV